MNAPSDHGKGGGKGNPIVRGIQQGLATEALISLGLWIGNLDAVDAFFDWLERFFSPLLTNMGITVVSETLSNFKGVLTRHGIPAEILHWVDEVGEGIRASRHARSGPNDRPVTKEDVIAGFNRGRTTARLNANEAREAFMAALQKLEKSKRQQLLLKIISLPPDLRQAFDARRKVIITTENEWLLQDLADSDITEWAGTLDVMFGPVPKPLAPGAALSNAVTRVIGNVAGAAKGADAAIRSFVAPAMSPTVTAALQQRATVARRRRSV